MELVLLVVGSGRSGRVARGLLVAPSLLLVDLVALGVLKFVFLNAERNGE